MDIILYDGSKTPQWLIAWFVENKMPTNTSQNCLYIVPTPIGNLGDITIRAVDILSRAALIYAEDTRRTRILCQHYGITTPLRSLHEHNETQRTQVVLADLAAGKTLVLVSDAGTPLISDPGHRLLPAVLAAGFRVVPLPGPCAAICALSASGLSTDAFLFAGFIPSRGAGREKRLQALQHETATLVFYESCHRIVAFCQLAAKVFGQARSAVIAREMSKQYEHFYRAPLGELVGQLQAGGIPLKGEFVVCIAGDTQAHAAVDANLDHVLQTLMQDCSLKSAVRIAVVLTGKHKREVYARALALQASDDAL